MEARRAEIERFYLRISHAATPTPADFEQLAAAATAAAQACRALDAHRWRREQVTALLSSFPGLDTPSRLDLDLANDQDLDRLQVVVQRFDDASRRLEKARLDLKDAADRDEFEDVARLTVEARAALEEASAARQDAADWVAGHAAARGDRPPPPPRTRNGPAGVGADHRIEPPADGPELPDVATPAGGDAAAPALAPADPVTPPPDAPAGGCEAPAQASIAAGPDVPAPSGLGAMEAEQVDAAEVRAEPAASTDALGHWMAAPDGEALCDPVRFAPYAREIGAGPPLAEFELWRVHHAVLLSEIERERLEIVRENRGRWRAPYDVPEADGRPATRVRAAELLELKHPCRQLRQAGEPLHSPLLDRLEALRGMRNALSHLEYASSSDIAALEARIP